MGPVKVELAGVAQSTWNFQISKAKAEPDSETRMFSRPAGGGVPLRFAGSRLK